MNANDKTKEQLLNELNVLQSKYNALKESCIKKTEELEFLSTIVEQSPISIIITDANKNIKYANPSLSKLTGYPLEEILGKNPSIFKTGYTSDEEYKKIWQSIVTDNEWSGKFCNKKKNGEIFWESVNILCFKNKTGEITHYAGLKKDISAQKIYEKELLEETNKNITNSEQLEAILDHIPGLIFYKDTKNNFIRVNKYMAEAHHLDKKEIEGKNLRELYPPADAEKYYQDDMVVINSGVAKLNMEEPWVTAGVENWVSTSKIPFVNIEGEIIGVIGISLDITERKKLEHEIQQKNKMLEKQNAEKDRFFSIIAHDLMSPFNTILGFSNLLIEKVKENNYRDIVKFSDFINTSSKHAVDLLNNLMTWARSQSGRIEFKPEYFDIGELMDEVILVMSDFANSKSISILKETENSTNIYADKNMIYTVLINLVCNAIKFTHTNGKIVITSKMEPDGLSIIVKDNGIGIEQDRLEKIFHIDENQSTPGTQKEKGTGLGMILCKDFVENHGGKLFVNSEINKGSEFCFTIPKNAVPNV